MDTSITKEVIRVIRDETKRRIDLAAQDPDVRWTAEDEIFINELWLMLLVTIHHGVERELVQVAARITRRSSIEGEQRIRDERENLRRRKGQFIADLQLSTLPEWCSMETLRLLANSYKHDPWTEPAQDLLDYLEPHLKPIREKIRRNFGLLDSDQIAFASLPESPALQAGLAASLGLKDNADYSEIADEFLVRAGRFLTELKDQLQKQSRLSPIQWAVASLDPKDMAH
ncbi:MAG TPA: hypothetical protein VLB76_04025 [Thermoanaerobaculia bacterium]|nr:hypothetical protein [Thermoanaerobaculia bacterium]